MHTTPPDPSETQKRREALFHQRRCPHCAERVKISVLLRNAPCPHCGQTSSTIHTHNPHELLSPILERWKQRRLLLYAILAVGTFATGPFPFASTVLTILFVIYMRYALIREPVTWFGPARKMSSRFTLRIWLLSTTLLTLVGNELLTFLPVVNMPLKMIVSLLGALLFVEGSLVFLKGRLQREASEDPSLQWWEWALPLTLIGGVVLLTVAAMTSMIAIYNQLLG